MTEPSYVQTVLAARDAALAAAKAAAEAVIKAGQVGESEPGGGGGGAVASVNGMIGAVTITKAHVNLGSVDNTSDANKPISNLTATALAGKAGLNATTGLIPIALMPPGFTLTIRKDVTTGFWPASWVNDTPVYTGGSASAGVRPTARTDVVCIWEGTGTFPPIVTSGTAGVLDGVDGRTVLP